MWKLAALLWLKMKKKLLWKFFSRIEVWPFTNGEAGTNLNNFRLCVFHSESSVPFFLSKILNFFHNPISKTCFNFNGIIPTFDKWLHLRKWVLYHSLRILFFGSVHNSHKFLLFDQREEGVSKDRTWDLRLRSLVLYWLPLPLGNRYSYLKYPADEIWRFLIVVNECRIITWVYVHLLSVVFAVSCPFQKSVKFSRFIH